MFHFNKFFISTECCSKLNITVNSENGIDNETSGEYELISERIRGRPVYLRTHAHQMALFYHENEWKVSSDPRANNEEDIALQIEGKVYSCPETEKNEESYTIATETSTFEVNIKCIGNTFSFS